MEEKKDNPGIECWYRMLLGSKFGQRATEYSATFQFSSDTVHSLRPGGNGDIHRAIRSTRPYTGSIACIKTKPSEWVFPMQIDSFHK